MVMHIVIRISPFSLPAVYHGPEGLREIATRVHRSTLVLAESESYYYCGYGEYILGGGGHCPPLKYIIILWRAVQKKRERTQCNDLFAVRR